MNVYSSIVSLASPSAAEQLFFGSQIRPEGMESRNFIKIQGPPKVCW